jgi:hypothetical protein
MYGEESPSWPGTDRPAPVAKAPWSGSGARWTVWPMRIILWAAILVIGYRGIMAIALNEKPASSSGAAATAGGPTTQFPVTLAEAFAMQFGRVYLTYNPVDAGTRQQQLGAFVAPNVLSANPQFGISGQGVMQLSSESPAGIEVRSANSAIVTLLATVNNRLMEFGVPIYTAGGVLVVSGLPSLLPAPPPPPQVQPPAPPQQDVAAANQLQGQLKDFFNAYASGNPTMLNRFVPPGASLAGLGGQVQFKGIVAGSLQVPQQQGGATRNITVTVDWQLTGQNGGFAATYDMTVVDQQGGRWYVKEIRASTQPMGTAP